MLKPHWCWVLGLDPGPVYVKHTVYHQAIFLALNEIDVDKKKCSKIIHESYLRKQL